MCPIKKQALKVLVKCRVRKLPIDVGPLCRKMGITAKLYTPDDDNDGISIIVDGKPYVFVGETSTPERQRFTAAHELGHILLGHVGKCKKGFCKSCSRRRIRSRKTIERQASVFAAELIMPQCLLYKYNVKTISQIQKIFGVSRQAAFYALKNLQRRKKGIPLSRVERKICRQFSKEGKLQ